MANRQFIFQSELPVSLEEAFAWHLRKGAIERLMPPWIHASFLASPSRPDQEGGQVGIKIKWGLFSFKWILEHQNFIPNQEFSDIQVHGPFRRYRHRHHFLPIDLVSFPINSRPSDRVKALGVDDRKSVCVPNIDRLALDEPLEISGGQRGRNLWEKTLSSCRLSDEISFAMPFGFLNPKVEHELARYFRWRHAILKEDLKMYDRYPQEPQRILLSGASGFIGSKLKIFLQLCGHEVVRLVRRKEEVAEDAIYWDPTHGNFQKDSFEGFDAVIHLAGAGLAQGRWTKDKKEQFFLSRCRDTWLLSQVLCRLYRPPKTVICASAIGFYGNRGSEELTEESVQGSGFLADLCGKWERATEPIENRGSRVVHARFGAVLSAQGGMLQKMLLPFRLGLGGKMGSGKHIISWIGIDDLLGSLYHSLMKENLNGAVNLVAPQPVSQIEFARILAKTIRRPSFSRIPAWALKMALGEMAEEMILSSQNVKPDKLLKTGYEFRYPDLQKALDFVI